MLTCQLNYVSKGYKEVLFFEHLCDQEEGFILFFLELVSIVCNSTADSGVTLEWKKEASPSPVSLEQEGTNCNWF